MHGKINVCREPEEKESLGIPDGRWGECCIDLMVWTGFIWKHWMLERVHACLVNVVTNGLQN
jgi:hypothetical protein